MKTQNKMSSVKFIALSWTVVTALALTSFISKKPVSNKKPADKGFAVIELFTSEGCSSCPPADALVAKVEKESAEKPVYILAFHVDYWNRLGWKDAFSSAEYSQRQNQYANWLHLQSVYTPQIVVNGHTEFVGSEEGTLRNAIKTSLQKDASVQLTLSDVKVESNKVRLQYQTQGNISNTVLLLALIQKTAQTKVERGENAGHTLSHVQIVRAIKSSNLRGSQGIADISVPAGFNPQSYELIAFLQDKSNGQITGAAKTSFPQAL